MKNEIKAGDRVTWGEKRDYRSFGHFLTDFDRGQDTAPLIVWDVKRVYQGRANIRSEHGSYWMALDELTIVSPDDQPLSDTAIVAAFVALPDEYADSRVRAITSLRLFAEPEDYDLVMAAGDLGGAEPNMWEYGL